MLQNSRAFDDAPDTLPYDFDSKGYVKPTEGSDVHKSFHRYGHGALLDAHDFATETNEMFGLRMVDDNLEEALLVALEHFFEESKLPHATVCGLVIGTLHKFIHNHRVFYRFIKGPTKPWPRDPKLIRAEIASRMPHALRTLEFELECAEAERSEQPALSE